MKKPKRQKYQINQGRKNEKQIKSIKTVLDHVFIFIQIQAVLFAFRLKERCEPEKCGAAFG